MKIRSLCLVGIAILALSLSACTAQVDRTSVQAQAGAPISAQVPEISIPYRHGSPIYVLAVEPIEFTPEAYREDQTLTIKLNNGSRELRAKLVSTLSRIGNVSVLDPRGLKRDKFGGYSAKLSPNERGPYLVKGTITDFAERIEDTSSGQGFHLGWIGIVTGIAGAVADKPGLFWPGAGLALASPGFSEERQLKSGMVAIDLQVVDGRTMRVVSAFRATGTFKAEEANSGWSMFGYANRSSDFAQSVLGQAMQLALNDAATRISTEVVR